MLCSLFLETHKSGDQHFWTSSFPAQPGLSSEQKQRGNTSQPKPLPHQSLQLFPELHENTRRVKSRNKDSLQQKLWKENCCGQAETILQWMINRWSMINHQRRLLMINLIRDVDFNPSGTCSLCSRQRYELAFTLGRRLKLGVLSSTIILFSTQKQVVKQVHVHMHIRGPQLELWYLQPLPGEPGRKPSTEHLSVIQRWWIRMISGSYKTLISNKGST